MTTTPLSADPVALRRTVRFALLPPGAIDPLRTQRHNPSASWPAVVSDTGGLGAYQELDIEVVGVPDPVTGYLINITEIDSVVRECALPLLTDRFRSQFLPDALPMDVLSSLPLIAARIAIGLPTRAGRTLRSVAWRMSPTLSYTFEFAMPDHVQLRQRFEFSASHRLHCPELDAAANRALFGKCNNPNGHGHNYRLEVAVDVPLLQQPRLTLDRIESIVDTAVIVRLDHKHLNSDVPEFASINPSVEHIARVCHQLLDPVLRAAGGALHSVTVWETEKTCCTYPS